MTQLRASWIGTEVARYADWLADEGYAARCVHSRVPLLVAFGEFTRRRGAKEVAELGLHVEAFVAERVGRFRRSRENTETARAATAERDQMGRVDAAPARLGGFQQLNPSLQKWMQPTRSTALPGGRGPRDRSCTVEMK